MGARRFLTAREQVAMTAPWRRHADSYPFDGLGQYTGPQWPKDLAHHLNADPGLASYNAGYDSYQHPAFVDHDSPLHAAKESWRQAGGRDHNPQAGTSFEDGYLDAEGEIPHRFLDLENHEGWRAERGENARELKGETHSGWDPDDDQDPFDPRLIGAALRRYAGDKADLKWERDAGGDWILVGRNPDGNPVAVRTERAPSVRTSSLRVAGDGMSWKDTVDYIDRVLAEGERAGADDEWNCRRCGNTPRSDGFFPSTHDGTEIEPTAEDGWVGHYACGRCGDVTTEDDHR